MPGERDFGAPDGNALEVARATLAHDAPHDESRPMCVTGDGIRADELFLSDPEPAAAAAVAAYRRRKETAFPRWNLGDANRPTEATIDNMYVPLRFARERRVRTPEMTRCQACHCRPSGS